MRAKARHGRAHLGYRAGELVPSHGRTQKRAGSKSGATSDLLLRHRSPYPSSTAGAPPIRAAAPHRPPHRTTKGCALPRAPPRTFLHIQSFGPARPRSVSACSAPAVRPTDAILY